MNKLISLTGMALALVLGACAQMGTSSVGTCSGASVCPIIIYEKFPNVFATFPDHMSIKSARPGNYPTLIWTFADQSKYTFLANTNTPSGDGVELIGTTGAKVGLKPCFITSDSRKDLGFASKGPYLRCEVADSATFNATRYRIRFHGLDGSEKMVDPTVDSSGTGDVGRRVAAASYQAIYANIGDNVHVPVLNAGSDGVTVVWDAGANGAFRTADGAYLIFKDQNGNDVDIEPCYISSDANGTAISTDSRYFFCLITTTTPSFTYTYEALYRDNQGTHTVTKKDFIRP